MDLFFFEDLKERAPGERSDGEEEDVELRPRPKRSRGPKLKEEINGGLLAVDTFSKRLAVVPIPKPSRPYRAPWRKPSRRWVGSQG